ncbi:MAG TPA: CBS domain-containing protein, partial [Candidatus Saccharibacteria bacterium]|nr:CBS domain-containing protein [Candidatus Saccharibacteria bacterium]
YSENNQNIIGTLYLRDAIRLQKAKPVTKIMRDDVYYINEAQPLDVALHGFIKTRHHLFVVVNEFEDVVGVLTIEDVIEQIIGHPIHDEDDRFDDLRLVAKSKAATKRSSRKSNIIS